MQLPVCYNPNITKWPNIGTVFWATVLQNALGHIALTGDLWSCQSLDSYIRMTAHFCARSQRTGNLVIHSHLVTFHHVRGSHSGVNIRWVFVRVLKEIGCLDKVCKPVFSWKCYLTLIHCRLVWLLWTMHPIITQCCKRLLMNSGSWVSCLMWMVSPPTLIQFGVSNMKASPFQYSFTLPWPYHAYSSHEALDILHLEFKNSGSEFDAAQPLA